MDIYSELEPLTVYNYDVSPAIDSLVRHVLKVIPDDYTEGFPSLSVFETYSCWGAHVEEGKVMCSPSLLEMPRDIAIGILAHEFAHVFLEHTGKGGLQEEHDADELTCKWGFAEEVRVMRQHLGPPTDMR